MLCTDSLIYSPGGLEMDVAKLVEQAVRAARRLDKDPELEGVAHESTLRAISSYDPARCDNLEAWVVYVVKVDAVGYLRKRNSRREERLASEPPCRAEQSTKLLVSRSDWELLCEKHVERWNFIAIARKLGVTIGRAKELVAAAEARFVKAFEDQQED